MDWIAIAALVLSVLSLWLQFGERSRADPIVRLVRIERADRKFSETQLVLTNAGAAAAREVSIEAWTPDGELYSEYFFRGADEFPIQIIAPAHEYRLHVAIRLGGPAALTLKLKWQDRRPFPRWQHRATVISLAWMGTA